MTNNIGSSEHDLYSPALAPVDLKDRSITTRGLGVIWFGIAVQITGFAAFSPMTNYFTIGELLWIYTIGSIILALCCFVTQDIGLKYGISFAASIVASFGYKGGKVVGVVRTLPSLIFFALNAYIGAMAINEISKILIGFDNIFVCLAINVIALVAITIKGVKGIERFSTIIAPLLAIVGVYMMYVVLTSYNVSLTDTLSMGRTAGTSKSWIFGFAVVVGLFSSVAMGINDITKDCKVGGSSKNWIKNNKLYSTATLIGIVPFLVFFTILGNITIVLSGRMDPLIVLSELIQERSIILAIVIQIFIVVAQASTNTAANLLPSAYVACSLMPKKLSFKVATVGVAIIACIIQPWNYMDKLDLILSLFSTTAGPALAIIGVDYYIFRKRQISLDDLFKSNGKYKYFKGYNPAALIVYVVATAIGFFFFLEYSFFVSTALASVFYYFVAKAFAKKYPVIIEEELSVHPIDGSKPTVQIN
ncbi:cytosine permease [Bacillus sp. FJAT-29937]|uniref:cytosine permease n=1 Tax=Bacillus sp. FJAT-29937 TaxID=1720553 RepID=UPI00082DCE7B|nr:cytosine permease [Bacillus sp. FJAT-29937]